MQTAATLIVILIRLVLDPALQLRRMKLWKGVSEIDACQKASLAGGHLRSWWLRPVLLALTSLLPSSIPDLAILHRSMDHNGRLGVIRSFITWPR